MEKVFAWRTIDGDKLEWSVKFTYGASKSVESISDWATKYEKLDVEVTVTLKDIEIQDYLFSGEEPYWILSWKCDDKFSGVNQKCKYVKDNTTSLYCTIPEGFCNSSLYLECCLITDIENDSEPEFWKRPRGSILTSFALIERTFFGRGNIFPLTEYSGDGRVLIHWDFFTIEDLDMSVSSAVRALIDLNHPFLVDKTDDKQIEGLKLMMVIQGFAHKAFNPSIFELLEENRSWRNGSLGDSFIKVLNKLASDLKISTFSDLKSIYFEKPELIDESIFRIYSSSINTRKHV